MKLLRRIIAISGFLGLILTTLAPVVSYAAVPASTKPASGVSASGLVRLINSMGLQPTYQMIDQPNNVKFWKFSLSFVNYALVAGLILAAFATVLRINVDTYSVKKILPAVFTGFILANMSKYICQLILQVSESIYTTFQHLGGGANIGGVMLDHFQTALVTVIAVIATMVVTGPGVIFAALAAITVIIFPILIEFCLLFMFIIRNYVVQFLVAVSPVAFLLFSLPFGKSYFQKWWSQFMLWAFMKPTAFFFIMLGAVILQTGIGGSLVGFVVGIAVLCLAIYVPFKSGGLINSTMLKLAKGAGGLARGGAVNAGASMENYKGFGSSIVNRAGQASSWVGKTGYLPEAIKGKYEEKKKKTDTRGLAGAYERLGDQRLQERLEEEEHSAHKKELATKSVASLASEILSGDSGRVAAAWSVAAEKGVDHHVFNALDDVIRNSNPIVAAQHRSKFGLEAGQFFNDGSYNAVTGEMSDNTAYNRSRAKVVSSGGTLSTNAAGNQTVTATNATKRHLTEIADANRKNGKAGEANSYIEGVDGSLELRNAVAINDTAASRGHGGNPREQMSKALPDNWFSKNSANTIIGFNPSLLGALSSGSYDGALNDPTHLDSLSSDIMTGASTPGAVGTMGAQLRAAQAAAAARPRTSMAIGNLITKLGL